MLKDIPELVATRCYFCAQLSDAMASRLAYRMIIGLTLCDEEHTDLGRMIANDLFTACTKYLLPCFVAVYSNASRNIISVETHTWYEKTVVWSAYLHFFSRDLVKRSSAKTGRIAHLRPIVREPLSNKRNKLFAICQKSVPMRAL